MTEDKNKESIFIKVINDWIKIVNSYGTEIKKKKKLIKKNIKKIYKIEKTKNNLMH